MVGHNEVVLILTPPWLVHQAGSALQLQSGFDILGVVAVL